MNLIFKTREEYLTERIKLADRSNEELEELLKELYQKRYIEQDINYESYYRLTSSVYHQRTLNNRLLTFHMKNLLTKSC